MQFADITKLGNIVSRERGWGIIQQEDDVFESSVIKNRIKSNNMKCKVMCLGTNYKNVKAHQLEMTEEGKDLGITA